MSSEKSIHRLYDTCSISVIYTISNGHNIDSCGTPQDISLYAVSVLLNTTVKPLYSEQSRDPTKCSLYGGVHPRGVRYIPAHMCLKYNVHILKLTS